MTRILITGAAGGIGQALLAEMRDGHDVLATDIRQPATLPEGAEYRPLDVRADDPDAVIGEWKPDVVVHLASIVTPPRGSTPALSPLPGGARKRRCEPMRAFADLLESSAPARVVNIASVAAHHGMANNAAYCASKAGLLGLGRCVSLEGAAHGVTCVSISPTWVETEMLRSFIDADIAASGKSREEVRADYAASNPQHQLVQPEEIADLAAFLVSDAGRAITMEDVQVNAGSLW